MSDADWLVLTGFGDGPAGQFRFTVRAGQIAAFTDSPKGGSLIVIAALGQLVHVHESPVEIAQMLGAPVP